MHNAILLQAYRLSEQLLGIESSMVDKVVSAGEATPGKKARGVETVTIQGQTLPLIDLRKLLGLSNELLNKEERLLITSGPHPVALRVDSFHSVLELPPERFPSLESGCRPYDEAVAPGVVRLLGGLLLIRDVESLAKLSKKK